MFPYAPRPLLLLLVLLVDLGVEARRTRGCLGVDTHGFVLQALELLLGGLGPCCVRSSCCSWAGGLSGVETAGADFGGVHPCG